LTVCIVNDSFIEFNDGELLLAAYVQLINEFTMHLLEFVLQQTNFLLMLTTVFPF